MEVAYRCLSSATWFLPVGAMNRPAEVATALEAAADLTNCMSSAASSTSASSRLPFFAKARPRLEVFCGRLAIGICKLSGPSSCSSGSWESCVASGALPFAIFRRFAALKTTLTSASSAMVVWLTSLGPDAHVIIHVILRIVFDNDIASARDTCLGSCAW